MTYQQYSEWLTAALEAYRETPPEAWRRRFIDNLMERSRTTATDAEEKTLHNLVALAYIADTQRAKTAICRALHISRNAYSEAQRRAVRRLMVLAFGVDGIDWR